MDKSISGEVAVFIECTSEAYVEKFIENLKNEDNYGEYSGTNIAVSR